MLHLVGETLDKSRAHYLASRGRITRLARGIYVDVDDDADAVVLRHAARIARHLYPRAYMSSASADLLGPTRDGRLLISGPRSQRTRIGALEIIQNVAPGYPHLSPAVVFDGLGWFRVLVSSPRQRFLEAFRLRSEHAAAIDEVRRATLAALLIDEYGGREEAANALQAIAPRLDWRREAARAERYLISAPLLVDLGGDGPIRLVVAWHGQPIGELRHDVIEWRWRGEAGVPPLVRDGLSGRPPPFLLSLLPEGWLERVLGARGEGASLRSGRRYMSNVAIGPDPAETAALPEDAIAARLDDWSADGIFAGRYEGPGRGDAGRGFEESLALPFADARTSWLAGAQIKAPMFLDPDGRLAPSGAGPFTHILKPAGDRGFEALPVVEWLAMRLGAAAGLAAPAVALAGMPDGMPPALVVERFDIRVGADDRRRIALEDMCSVLDLPPDAKYDGTMERAARAVRARSTAPGDDLLLVLRRALFAWLIADGDMHLKNLALLKAAEPGDAAFASVRVAPLYDAVTTRVFPGLERDRMALPVSGRDDRLRRADFLRLASVAGIPAREANAAMDELAGGLSAGLDAIALPDVPNLDAGLAAAAERMLGLCRERVLAWR